MPRNPTATAPMSGNADASSATNASSDDFRSKLTIGVVTAVITAALSAGITFSITYFQLTRSQSYWEEQQKLLRYQKHVDRMTEELDRYLQHVSTTQTLRSDLVNYLQQVRLTLAKYRDTPPSPQVAGQISVDYSKKFLDFAASFNSLTARLVTIKILFGAETATEIDAALAKLSAGDGRVLKEFYPPEPALLTAAFRDRVSGSKEAISNLDLALAQYLQNENKTVLLTTVLSSVSVQMATAVKTQLSPKQ